jgi:hypothetical protein
MGKAKTASKNNPTAREKAREFFYNGKKIKPAKFIADGRSFFAAEYEDGTVVVDVNQDPVPWSKVKHG